jgi:uncharacterized protein with PQ loop repeat
MKTPAIHIDRRKRLHDLKHEFPSPDPGIRFLDNVCLGAGIIAPLTAVPQVLKIFMLKNAAGVSLLFWALVSVLAVPFIIYGIVHKAKPIIVMHSLWLMMDIIVVIGTMMYG